MNSWVVVDVCCVPQTVHLLLSSICHMAMQKNINFIVLLYCSYDQCLRLTASQKVQGHTCNVCKAISNLRLI